MAKGKTSKAKSVNGQNWVYFILQYYNKKNPTSEEKQLLEKLILSGGVWFRPETFAQIPVLRPYVIRDSSCRNKDPKKDAWSEANCKGLMRDDNSSIKSLPQSLSIISPRKEMNMRRIGVGWVASHIWISMQSRKEHSCEWECANSFIPNLVWLPTQLSKLTDRDGSYAQQFVQHISYMLYSKIPLPSPMLSGIWSELKNPGITPITKFNANDLNYFEHNAKWINQKKTTLHKELQSILDILSIPSAAIPRIIYNERYTTTLRAVSTTMIPIDKIYLRNWITENRNHLVGASAITAIMTKTAPTGTKKTSVSRRKSPKSSGASTKFTPKQIANSIKAYLFDGDSFRGIETKYLGMSKMTNGGGWEAKRLLESYKIDSSMKKTLHDKSIPDAIAWAKEPLKSTLIWMKDNL